MRILVNPNDLGENFSTDDTSAVVTRLRQRGFSNVYVGEVQASRGDMSGTDVLRLAELINEVRRTSAGGEWPVAPGAVVEWPGVQVLVASRLGHEPLRVPLDVWTKWDVFDRTAAIFGYVSHCITSEREKRERVVVEGSERLARVVQVVVAALPPGDRVMFDFLRIRFVEAPELKSVGVNGRARNLANGERVIEIAPVGEGDVDNKLVKTIVHEILHHTRDHVNLLQFVQTDEEFSALTAVFDRQAYAQAGGIAYDAVPPFTI